MIKRLGTYFVMKCAANVVSSPKASIFSDPLVQKKHYFIDDLPDVIFLHTKVLGGFRSYHLVHFIR